RRIAPTLIGAIDRAVTLCSKTLRFALEGRVEPEMAWFALRPLVDEIAAAVAGLGRGDAVLENQVPDSVRLHADREQLFRVLFNLVRNAFEAGAGRVAVSAGVDGGETNIEITDDGPGLPR